jgi:ABC-type glutathione transport system ATPase component
MVTHDLRMVQYADTVVSMRDGNVARILTDRAEIAAMAATSREEHLPALAPAPTPRIGLPVPEMQPAYSYAA